MKPSLSWTIASTFEFGRPSAIVTRSQPSGDWSRSVLLSAPTAGAGAAGAAGRSRLARAGAAAARSTSTLRTALRTIDRSLHGPREAQRDDARVLGVDAPDEDPRREARRERLG